MPNGTTNQSCDCDPLKEFEEKLEQARVIKDMALAEMRRVVRNAIQYKVTDTSVPVFTSMVGKCGFISYEDGRMQFHDRNGVTMYASGRVERIIPDEVGKGLTVYTKNGHIKIVEV